MSPEDSERWINENIIGGITKEKLDKQRHGEVNSLDMLQNTSIVYHPESVLEMQFLCLITIFLTKESHLKSNTYDKTYSDFILVALIVMHIL